MTYGYSASSTAGVQQIERRCGVAGEVAVRRVDPAVTVLARVDQQRAAPVPREPRRRGDPCQARRPRRWRSRGSSRAQQPALDDGERERLVADLVEEDDDRCRPRSAARRPRPTRRCATRAPSANGSSRPRRRRRPPGAAVVAVPARPPSNGSPKYDRSELAPAAVASRRTRASCPRASARARARSSSSSQRRAHGVARAGARRARLRPRRRATSTAPASSRREHGGRELRLRQLASRSCSSVGVDRAVAARLRRPRPPRSARRRRRARAGEEPPQPEVLGAVEEHRLGPARRRARRGRPPGSRRRATRRSRRGRRSARSACRCPCRTRSWRR